MDIRKVISWLFNHLESLVALFSIVGGGVVIAISWLSSIPLYQLVMVILFTLLGVLALVILILNQYRQFRTGRQKKIAELNDKDMERTIRDWLDKPTFIFKREVSPDCLFRFIVADRQGRPVTISRYKSEPSTVLLTTAITLNDEHRKKHDTLNERQKKMVSCNLRIEMERYGIGQEGIDNELKRAVLSDPVLLDNSLNEVYLHQRIFFVTGAFALYSTVVERELMFVDEQENRKEDSQR
jgi:hypothetical protein